MSFELVPLKPEQHTVTFVPRVTIELPFFNLTPLRRDIPKVIRYQGRDDAGRPLKWEVYQDTSSEIGAPAVEAHEAWYLLVKPSIDSRRREDGTMPEIIPLGGIRQCLRKVGWTAGGHQARELIKALTQISFAGCVADLWLPTGEHDVEGKEKFLQVKGRFSRMSIYAIGEHHLTEEQLAHEKFDFDLEDILYIRLDPLEAKLQQLQERRVLDNQYLFSVNPAGRRWYELMAAKIFGVINNHGEFCEIRYSWYIKHHHTLKRQFQRFRVVEQMKRVVRDHMESGYLRAVEYRAVKEPEGETDYIIRYYPGEGAKQSISRIRTHLRKPKTKTSDAKIPGPISFRVDQIKTAAIPPQPAENSLMTASDVEKLMLINRLFTEFGISLFTALILVKKDRPAVISQLKYWPHRTVQLKGGVAGWMIRAIEQNYQPPSDFNQRAEQQKKEAISAARASLIANCAFCKDGNGFRTLEQGTGQRSVRQCTHDPSIESKFGTTNPINEQTTL